MKISEIIKENRIKQGYTQEKLGEYLGVSAPAVNKWERGLTYPDITILPSLARLLGIDLNTLLSFEEDLTDEKINSISLEISTIAKEGGFIVSYEKAQEYIYKYPTCHKLILNLAVILQGNLVMFLLNEDKQHLSKIEKLYLKCLESNDNEIKNLTYSMLCSYYIATEQFDTADEFLNKIPSVNIDISFQKVTIAIKRNELDKASKLLEQDLIESTNKINFILSMMSKVSLIENRNEDAKYYINLAEKTVSLFDMWDYIALSNYFLLYTELKDSEALIQTLDKMLHAIKNQWDMSSSKLYQHLDKVDTKEDNKKLFEAILMMLKTNADNELDFVFDNPKFQAILDKYS